MTCYHPLKAFIVGTNADTGKKILKVKPYETQFIYHFKEDHNKDRWFSNKTSLCASSVICDEKLCIPKECDRFELDPNMEQFLSHSDYSYDFYTIPCGQCIGCRIQYSRVWANRMMMERKMSKDCYFVTLTYDDQHIPESEYVSEITGEVCTSYTLRKKDIQDFNKRLRKHFNPGVKFYAAGEYGSKYMRPHYHVIYFNLPLSDLRDPDPLTEPIKSHKGFPIQVSDLIKETWGKGFVTVQPVTWETCAYVARYVTKKQNGANKEIYSTFNIEPEFALMSRKPGIGKLWYDKYGEKAYETDIIRLSTPDGRLKFHPPGYFDSLYDIGFHEELEQIKDNRRKMMEDQTRLKLSMTSLSLLEMLSSEEYNFKHRIDSLTRD